MRVLHRHFKYKLATKLLGRHSVLIRKVINSVFAVKGTNIERQVVSLMAGGKNCLLSIVLYFKKTKPKTPFLLFTTYSKMRADLFSSRIGFLVVVVKHSALHYKVRGKL